MSEKKETIYPKGLRTFKPHEKSPDFVKGTLIITLNELVKFCKENPELLTEYKEQKQLKCQILDGKDGLYLVVDTWKPEKKDDNFNDVEDLNKDDDLPF